MTLLITLGTVAVGVLVLLSLGFLLMEFIDRPAIPGWLFWILFPLGMLLVVSLAVVAMLVTGALLAHYLLGTM